MLSSTSRAESVNRCAVCIRLRGGQGAQLWVVGQLMFGVAQHGHQVAVGVGLKAQRDVLKVDVHMATRAQRHGAKFALKSPPPPAQHRQITLGGTPAQLSAWTGLHFKALPRLVGLVVRVEFLKADGTPKYRRPLWLFWTGPDTMALEVIAQIYLARYGIEHFFRFAKQRLGLLCAQTPTLAASETWVWLVALAYTVNDN